MKLIQKYWEEFASGVIHPDAQAAQRRDMRAAFFEGAHAILHFCKAADSNSISDDEWLQILELLEAECLEVLGQLQRGEA